MTLATNDHQYGLPDFTVNPVLGRGTHQTIQAAITEAVSGQTIGINPATYTENITLKSGITIVALGIGLPSVGVPVLVGKISAGTTENCQIEGLLFQNNGDVIFEDNGTTTGTIEFNRCWYQADGTNNIFVGSNTSRTVLINRCTISCPTGSKVFGLTGVNLEFRYCNFGDSPSISTISAGTVSFHHCIVAPPLQTTGTAGLRATNSTISSNNQLIWDLQGTGNNVAQICSLRTNGSAVAINIGAGVSLVATQLDINTNNANPITGTGSISYDSLGFVQNTAQTISPTISTGSTRINSLRLGSDTSILQNYETGTWTPTIQSSNSNMSTISYITQAGRYTRIGNIVSVYAQVVYTATAGTGFLEIRSLPFTVRNVSTYFPQGTVQLANLVYPASTSYITLQAPTNSTIVYFIANKDNAATERVATDAGGNILISLVYEV